MLRNSSLFDRLDVGVQRIGGGQTFSLSGSHTPTEGQADTTVRTAHAFLMHQWGSARIADGRMGIGGWAGESASLPNREIFTAATYLRVVWSNMASAPPPAPAPAPPRFCPRQVLARAKTFGLAFGFWLLCPRFWLGFWLRCPCFWLGL